MNNCIYNEECDSGYCLEGECRAPEKHGDPCKPGQCPPPYECRQNLCLNPPDSAPNNDETRPYFSLVPPFLAIGVLIAVITLLGFGIELLCKPRRQIVHPPEPPMQELMPIPGPQALPYVSSPVLVQPIPFHAAAPTMHSTFPGAQPTSLHFSPSVAPTYDIRQPYGASPAYGIAYDNMGRPSGVSGYTPPPQMP